MATQYMPSRGERTAPTFDKDKPRELSRFFKDLEKLFTRVGVTIDKTQKDHVLEYVPFEVEQIWKTFPEYADPTKTYINYRDAILVHYPDATGDYVYSPRDMEELIESRLRAGIQTTDDLQAFHLSFLAITTWLIEKDQMGDFEQKRGYLRAFQQPLLAAIKNRLQMLHTTHHPNKPHKVSDVHEAARYILQSEDSRPQSNYSLPQSSYSSPQAPVVPIASSVSKEISFKPETFASVMASFSKTIADALSQSNRTRVTGATPGMPRNTDCNFCGGAHFIRECPIVEEYVVAGKCRRNFEGKVILSTGAFCPRDIPGTLLRERIDEWHHRNPNQLSVATLIHTISTDHLRNNSEGIGTTTFQLSEEERITTLEAELFNLRARRPAFTPVIKTRAQRARDPISEATIEEIIDAHPVRGNTPGIIEIEQPSRPTVPRQPIVLPTPEITITTLPAEEPEHPFRNTKDAAYAPPTSKNVGAPVKIPVVKAATPAYKTLPPIYDTAIAIDVYKRAMDSSIMITQRELLSLSPEVRTQVRDDTTTRRVPTVSSPANARTALYTIEEEDEEDEEISQDTVPSFALQDTYKMNLPDDAVIIGDPIESYYNSLSPGEAPDLKRLKVAMQSTAIRSIIAVVDSRQKKECTVDPGCQVVAMSELTCHGLTLAYDPRIRLHMESANGTLDWSLGLARNVPFLIGSITVYLQVHVIRSPSYDILLGRPFDVLTASVIRNYADENQTITITDPNTDQKCTIPTFARGTYCSNPLPQPDF
jgi:hypothetical protein